VIPLIQEIEEDLSATDDRRMKCVIFDQAASGNGRLGMYRSLSGE
jgi:hypothetical protein